MNTNYTEITIKALMESIAKGEISKAPAIQRKGNVWSDKEVSSLIDSIVTGYPISSITVAEVGGTRYLVDGLQRVSVLERYFANEFSVLGSTDERIEGKKYVNLSDEVKDALHEYKVMLIECKESSQEEMATIFIRLNSGKTLSEAQKSRGELGEERAARIAKILSKDFFKYNVKFSAAQKNNEMDLECIEQYMYLAGACINDGSVENYAWKNISGATMKEFCATKLKDYPMSYYDDVEQVVSFAEGTGIKALRKTEVPMILIMAKFALINSINGKKFKKYATNVKSCIFESEEYKAYMGSGNIGKAKTEGRLGILLKEFMDMFPLADSSKFILSVKKNNDETIDTASEETVASEPEKDSEGAEITVAETEVVKDSEDTVEDENSSTVESPREDAHNDVAEDVSVKPNEDSDKSTEMGNAENVDTSSVSNEDSTSEVAEDTDSSINADADSNESVSVEETIVEVA